MRAFLKRGLIVVGICGLLGVVALGAGALWLASTLPSVETLIRYRPDVPMRIYTAHGELIGEYGPQRRLPLPLEAIPTRLKNAFLAAEDASFFDHPGIDFFGIIRALIADIKAGGFVQGGSTITQQVARTFFLTRERTILRKLREAILTFQIEGLLTKEKILSLYLNQIYLGNGAYGVEAAAQNYYGHSVHALSLAEAAMLAGLPKAPALYNPVRHPKLAKQRRDYVLRQIQDLSMAEPAAIEKALATPIHAARHKPVANPAPWITEEVRRRMVDRYGTKRAYTAGLQVFTGVDRGLQMAAREALQQGLLAYTRRHGFRGPEAHIDLKEVGSREAARRALEQHQRVGPLWPALVLELGERQARVLLPKGTEVTLPWHGLKWARPYTSTTAQGPRPQEAADILDPGDIVRVQRREGGWHLSQIPKAQGALVAMDPASGRIRALVGGFTAHQSSYNRATQARRQAGSAFKPFLYAGALAQGLTPATLINDAPLVFEGEALERRWRPENYSQTFHGPTRLRAGLEHSRNLVTIRLVKRLGVDFAVDFASRFGFDAHRLPRNLSLSLGSASLTLAQMVRGYAVFANGGIAVEPRLIQRVEARGRPRSRHFATGQCLVCHRAPAREARSSQALQREPERRFHEAFQPRRVLSPQLNYQMVSLLQGVIERGTGWRARRLDRPAGGKTGTSDRQRDAWFIGFTPGLVTGVWVGFDQPQTLGRQETGSRAASPIWTEFMAKALKDQPTRHFERPPGLVNVRIDAETGKLAAKWSDKTLFEVFRVGNAPSQITPRPLSTRAKGEQHSDTEGGTRDNSPNPSKPSRQMLEELF